MRSAQVLVVAACVALPLTAATACAGSDGGSTTMTVLAAASLTESFLEIERAFEESNPEIDVQISFGPSSGLVSQVLDGARADVLATANIATMDLAVQAGSVDVPVVFATNSLTLALPAANPAGITDFADLAQPGVLIAVCEPRVPCGAAAEQVFAASGLPIEPATYELDVKAVLNKVILDEVDAGLVYATDVLAAGEAVLDVKIPEGTASAVSYPIAVLSGSTAVDSGQRFVDFVLGAQGQAILATYGFGTPE